MYATLLFLAQGIISPSEVGIPTPTDDVVLQSILNIFYFLVGVVAVIVIILAGIRYSTSGGDSGKVASAKNQILYAVVGLIVILCAFAVTNFVVGRF